MVNLFKSLSASRTALLISLLLSFVIGPVFEYSPYLRLVINISFSFILLSGLWGLQRGKFSWLGIAIAVPALILRWAVYLGPWSAELTEASIIIEALFWSIVTALILTDVMKAHKVNYDTLSGAVSGYLLLGLCFANIHYLVDILSPGAYSITEGSLEVAVELHGVYEYIYYSFVTLTTLGFGDTTPLAKIARNLTVVEAVLGQMFLAILVARLVGISVAQELKEKD